MQMWASPGGRPARAAGQFAPTTRGSRPVSPLSSCFPANSPFAYFCQRWFWGFAPSLQTETPSEPMSVAGGLGRDAQIRRSPAPRAPCVRGAASALLGARASAAGQAPRGRAAPRLVQPAPTALVPTGRQTSADAGPLSLRKLSYFQAMNYFPRAVLNSSRSSAAPQWTLCDSASSFRLA